MLPLSLLVDLLLAGPEIGQLTKLPTLGCHLCVRPKLRIQSHIYPEHVAKQIVTAVGRLDDTGHGQLINCPIAIQACIHQGKIISQSERSFVRHASLT